MKLQTQQICSCGDCSRPVFNKRDKCVLHCEKKNYREDKYNADNIGLLSDFKDELVDYISEQIFNLEEPGNVFISTIRTYLDDIDGLPPYDDGSLDFSKVVTLYDIFFPARDSRDNFDYLKILKRLKGVHFDNCSFSDKSLPLDEIPVFYQKCTFTNFFWSQGIFNVFDDSENVLFQSSTFKGNFSFFSDENSTFDSFTSGIFSDCIFEKKLELDSININILFKNSEEGLKLNTLKISNCHFSGRFELLNHEIKNVTIENTSFDDKFSYQKNITGDFKLINCNFEKTFDLFESQFDNFSVNRSVFEKFAGFENCRFSCKEQSKEAVFEYVTFNCF